MDAVVSTREDSRAALSSLKDELALLVGEDSPTEPKQRAKLLAAIKDRLAESRARIKARFLAGAEVHKTMSDLACTTDLLVQDLLDFAIEKAFPAPNPTTGDRIALVAVGGYGRGELAPYSDIDLLFLLPYKKTPRTEQIIEYMLYMLWDAGLKVGHATRTVDECIRLAKQDITIRTSILEIRFLRGESELFEQLRKRFWKDLVDGTEGAFLDAKLLEREERHRRLGDSRYLVEPNVKEGKGGLRDLHTLSWIAKYLYRVERLSELVPRIFTRAELKRFERAESFLSTVRCHLHYLVERPEERLTFDVQVELGARMGYTDHTGSRGVERFMKHYYLTAKEVGSLTRILCAALEADHRGKPRFSLARLWPRRSIASAFAVDGGRLDIIDPDAFDKDPVLLLRLFHVAQQQDLDIHPNALRHVTRKLRLIDADLKENPEANRLFLEMLTSPKDPESALRRLSEAGVFGRFIPPFGRIVAQMQYDMYHTYTVDEHTIRAIGVLHSIEKGDFSDSSPIATEVVQKILSRRVLYMAVLLHDIAKGRGRDHSVAGAEIAEELCPRVGLDPAETETVSWLVRHHLLMSNTVFKRDINDPKTVRDFAEIVQSPERLRLLLVLTVTDIRAVGPNVWNSWKATLLREIYLRADGILSGGSGTGAQAAWVAEAQTRVREKLSDWSTEDFDRYVDSATPAYWLAFETDTLTRHARLANHLAESGEPLSIDMHADHARGATEITVCAADHPGLFSRIAGAMATAGANVVDARIFTFQSGIALDTFWVQDGEGNVFERSESLKRLRSRIEQALRGTMNLKDELHRGPAWPTRTSVFTVTPRILIDNKASATHTVIEVNGRDRPGFLHDVTRALTRLALQIATARVSTYGENAVDVFYVKDVFGLKIEHEAKLKQIRDVLQQALTQPAVSKSPRPAAARGRRRTGAAAAS